MVGWWEGCLNQNGAVWCIETLKRSKNVHKCAVKMYYNEYGFGYCKMSVKVDEFLKTKFLTIGDLRNDWDAEYISN